MQSRKLLARGRWRARGSLGTGAGTHSETLGRDSGNLRADTHSERLEAIAERVPTVAYLS